MKSRVFVRCTVIKNILVNHHAIQIQEEYLKNQVENDHKIDVSCSVQIIPTTLAVQIMPRWLVKRVYNFCLFCAAG